MYKLWDWRGDDVQTTRLRGLLSLGCLDSCCSPSGKLLQRWPSSDCQQKAVSSASFVPRHWTVPGTLRRANWTCVMKPIAHEHGCEAAEFIWVIYCLLLHLRNEIPLCVSDAAIMVHYGEVTEMEQGVLMDAGVILSIEQCARDASNKMAANQQHGSDCEGQLTTSAEKMLNTFTCCLCWGPLDEATQQSFCSDFCSWQRVTEQFLRRQSIKQV